MRDDVTRRPIPIEQSILWRPLRDPHYVVASLQPADGGRRKIVVRQQVLGRVEALVRAHGRHALGLLLGQFYHCPVTGTEYLVIESVAEQNTGSDENEIAGAISEALAGRLTEHRSHNSASAQVLGWYRGVPAVEAKPSVTTAGIHASLFGRPWQTTLVVGEAAHGPGGAFFLHDTVNSRWFYAPFYELPEHAPKPPQPKPTVVDWPQYMTADSVTPGGRELTPVVELADVRRKNAFERAGWRRSAETDIGVHPGSSLGVADVPLLAAPSESLARPTSIPGTLTPGREPAEPAVADAAALSDRPAARPVHDGLADVTQTLRERSRRAARPGGKLSIVDDRDQRMVVASTGRAVIDTDDTTIGDAPNRYIELARSEGFFIAARFDAMTESSPTETLWVLNEPYSGMLLAVVTTDSEVVDATLHYNLQTDDAGLQRTPFPEHRDSESKTIYVRETCVDSLRARCRRLRATNGLLREWRVTPSISFLTPGEWESVPVWGARSDHGEQAISTINNARIAELPAGVRSQFHIGTAGDATA